MEPKLGELRDDHESGAPLVLPENTFACEATGLLLPPLERADTESNSNANTGTIARITDLISGTAMPFSSPTFVAATTFFFSPL